MPQTVARPAAVPEPRRPPGLSRAVPPGAAVGATAGALWWAVGTLALPVGVGTLVLAAGLLGAGWLVRAVGRRPDAIARLAVLGQRRLVGGLALALLAGAVLGWVLGRFGYGELSAPVAAMVLGAYLVPMAGRLDVRGLVPLGSALMVLGAAGVLLALRSAGQLYPLGTVGLGAGALCWLAVAARAGLLRNARNTIGSR